MQLNSTLPTGKCTSGVRAELSELSLSDVIQVRFASFFALFALSPSIASCALPLPGKPSYSTAI